MYSSNKVCNFASSHCFSFMIFNVISSDAIVNNEITPKLTKISLPSTTRLLYFSQKSALIFFMENDVFPIFDFNILTKCPYRLHIGKLMALAMGLSSTSFLWIFGISFVILSLSLVVVFILVHLLLIFSLLRWVALLFYSMGFFYCFVRSSVNIFIILLLLFLVFRIIIVLFLSALDISRLLSLHNFFSAGNFSLL